MYGLRTYFWLSDTLRPPIVILHFTFCILHSVLFALNQSLHTLQ